ncbi:MAG: hypothetical protein ACREJC_17710 [Tepidisphaeraceae bacterium]
MPAQALIRNLTRPQVEKAIADSKQKLSIQDSDGQILVVIDGSTEGTDPAALKALQGIADADSAITLKNQEDVKTKAAAAKAKTKADAEAKAAAKP